jgi:hypothetical protein
LVFKNGVAVADKKYFEIKKKHRAYAYVSVGNVYWFIFW